MIIIFSLIILLFSIVIHEVAHGSVAYHLGDPTAKYAGRLTLNPLKHLDPFGSVLLPLLLVIINSPFLIGWAKPVPINPYNFRDQKWGTLKVSIAGPAANLFLALFFGLLLRVFLHFSILSSFYPIFSFIVFINLLLAIFNLLPVPPLDGSHILFAFLPERWRDVKIFLQQYGLFILIFVIFFGLGWIFKIVGILYSLITGQSFIM